MRKIARTIAAMLAAEAVFTEGRQAVIDRASAVIDADTLDEPVVRFARRRLLRRRPAPANANLPDTRADAIRFAAAFVAANHAVLDAVAAADSSALDPAADAIEAEIAELEPATAAQRFGDDSASLLPDSGPIPTSTSRRSTRSPAPPRISPPSWRSRCT